MDQEIPALSIRDANDLDRFQSNGTTAGHSIYRPFGTLRFALALLVLVQHGLVLLAWENRNFFYNMELGILSVFTFFAISGFIVAEANATFYADRPYAFLANRVLRLVPPYLAALILVVIVEGAFYLMGRPVSLDAPLTISPISPRALLSGVLDIVPGFQPKYLLKQDFSPVPFAWTLRIEFLFYILAFVTYLAMMKLRGSMGRAIPYVMLGIGYALFGVFLRRNGHVPEQLGLIPFFLFGLGVFFVWQKPNRFTFSHLVVAAVCVLLALPHIKERGHPVLAYQLPVLIVLLSSFTVLAFVRRVPERFKALDKRLGELSYPLYINHGTILLLLLGVTGGSSFVAYAFAIPLSIGLAAIMNKIVETPLRGIRDRLRGRSL